jgi:Domain of unknown function (DUF4157)
MAATRQQMKTASPVPANFRVSAFLQRQCACGNRTMVGGQCAECAKKKGALQRKLTIGANNDPLEQEADRIADQVMAAPTQSTVARAPLQIQRFAGKAADEADAAPVSVNRVLAGSGRPLEPVLREDMEQRFGHDFSQVRVHAGYAAEQSVRDVNAHAYTVGHNIVFGAGQFAPTTNAGQRLLAHELTHVVQQQGSTNTARMQASQQSSLRLMRKLKAARTGDPVPGTPAAGSAACTQSRGEAIEDYLRHLSPGGAPRVDRSSGDVSINGDFCESRGFFGRVARGIGSGAKKGFGIGAYFLGVGAIPGALLGGLIGGIAGIFGSDSKAEDSSTPTGSTCICDLINSVNTWTIHLHDFSSPANIEGATITDPVTSNLDRQAKKGFVVVPAPNAAKRFGAATKTGQLQDNEPWLILGHEMCGHAWLQDRAPRGQGDEEGHVEGDDLRHHRTVERENLIRAEHGMEARGFRLKDPFCGESFARDRSVPNAPAQFGQSVGDGSGTRLDECQQAREQFFPKEARRFKVSERIP